VEVDSLAYPSKTLQLSGGLHNPRMTWDQLLGALDRELKRIDYTQRGEPPRKAQGY
jgi:hypothetical protein